MSFFFFEFRLTLVLLELPHPHLHLKEIQGIRCKKEVFYYKGVETVEQVAQGGGRCPIPGNIQCQAG